MQNSQKRTQTIVNFKAAASIVFSPDGAFAGMHLTVTGMGIYALSSGQVAVGLYAIGSGALLTTASVMSDQRMRRAAGAGLSRTATLVRKVAARLGRSGPVLLAALTVGFKTLMA